jgi:quinolinate synthase
MSFPSLRIEATQLSAQGSFAVSQASFLSPDPDLIEELDVLLKHHNVGVVAHFYMDAELQGVLSACSHPHIFVADSLLMSDHAVTMAEAGVASIVVLGVDFMSENVRAVLDAAGHKTVPVYRVDEREIGCSLAEAAQSRMYQAWLQQCSELENALHVVYINTSLRSKAIAHQFLPTITCTSSNVLQTMLQVSAEKPETQICYGPDTYMGRNLEVMLTQIAQMDAEEIASVHPSHTRESIQRLLSQYRFYKQGNCIVHHMFGGSVVEKVATEYAHAYHTAHLEVPGEMFELAVAAQNAGRGVVGSTSNILQFILAKVDESTRSSEPRVIPVVLGTEAGMITAIVRKVQEKLQQANRADIAVEIIFPVAADAVAQDDDFGVVPGVSGGEGCSTAGGCATCPFMKMNTLDALMNVVSKTGDLETLQNFEPKKYAEDLNGRTVAEVGGEPILFMRHFQRHGRMSDRLLELIE